jgi:hypothetical protein
MQADRWYLERRIYLAVVHSVVQGLATTPAAVVTHPDK